MNSIPFFTRLHISLQRLIRWEFWPWKVVYLPIAVYWFFLAIRAKGWVFFSAANPKMKFGGFVAYSKWDVLSLVPNEFIPKTIVVEPNTDSNTILAQKLEYEMELPLIIKPDMGERGKGVKILRDENALNQALKQIKERMLLQQFENLPMELGILYSRHPSEDKGKISSIVIKEFPILIGDGKSTLQQLILSNLRTRLNYKVLVKKFKHRLSEIPEKGRKLEMVELGNHMLGTTFLNGNHLITQELEGVFDDLAKQIDGFFIGRFDLKTASIKKLAQGNFKVIEVNGVTSEPAHIYDARTPLWVGIRDLLKHWNRIYHISVANHKNGVAYASFSEIRKEIKRHNREGAKHE